MNLTPDSHSNTRSRTKEIAYELFKAGIKPNISKVRERMNGKGGQKAIQESLDEWWLELSQQYQSYSSRPEIPEAAFQFIDQAWSSLLNGARDTFEEERSHLQNTLTELQEQLNNAHSTRQTLVQQLSTLEAQAQQQAVALTDQDQQIEALTQRYTDLEQTFAQCQLQAKQTEQHLSDQLTLTQQQLQQTRDDKAADDTRHQAAMTRLETRLTEQQNRAEAVQHTQQQQLSEQALQCQQAQNRIASLKQEQQHLTERHTELQARHTKTERERDALRTTHTEQAQQLQVQQTHHQHTRQQLDNKQAQLDRRVRRLDQLQIAHRSQQLEIQRLRQQLATDAALKTLMDQLRHQQSPSQPELQENKGL